MGWVGWDRVGLRAARDLDTSHVLDVPAEGAALRDREPSVLEHTLSQGKKRNGSPVVVVSRNDRGVVSGGGRRGAVEKVSKPCRSRRNEGATHLAADGDSSSHSLNA